MAEEHFIVIAIDGPAGAGKSSVARLLAERLQITYLDTGAMYRAVTYKMLRRLYEELEGPGHGIPESIEGEIETRLRHRLQTLLADPTALDTLLKQNDLQFQLNAKDRRLQITLDRADITEKIRWPSVAHFVSLVAQSPEVRNLLVAMQRKFGKKGNVVMEGRDIGTRVFPHSPHKFFVTAGAEERARRRFKELQAKGLEVNLAELTREIAERDRRDSTRAESPLVRAEDAVEIDTTSLSLEEVVNRLIQLMNQNKFDNNEAPPSF